MSGGHDGMNDLLQAAAERASRYLEGLDARGVSASPESLARLTELDVPLPDAPLRVRS